MKKSKITKVNYLGGLDNYEDEQFEGEEDIKSKSQRLKAENSQREEASHAAGPTDDAFHTMNEYSDTGNQLQQSQQVNSGMNDSQRTPKSVQYPVPKPMNGQVNRPQTQAKQVAKHAGKIQDIIYNPNPFQIGRSGSHNRPTTQGAFLPQNFNATGYDPSMQSSLTYSSQQAQFQLTSINRKNSDKPPINNYVTSNRQQYSVDKDPRGRRQFISHILKMQNHSATDVQAASQLDTSPLKQQREASTSIMNLKRKKIKELLFGAGQRTNYQGLNIVEREELQHEKRTLKVQNNVMKDENTRLKTKIQTLQGEIVRKDKDIEVLTVKLQQSFGVTTTQVKDNIYESFLVSQLKKQNRELKQDLEDKETVIDKLKRDIKLTKGQEMDTELQTYMEECSRLRQMLEACMFNQAMSQPQPHLQQPLQQQTIQEQARIEEAFYEKELQLQREAESHQQALQQLMQEREARERVEKKWAVAELRLKKFNAITAENKRKQQIIADKNMEVLKLTNEVDQLRDKARERDAANNKNKELVTKHYSMQSALDQKEKRVQELNTKCQELELELRALQKNQQKSPLKAVTKKIPEIVVKPPIQNAVSTPAATSLAGYNATQVELLFRGIKGQPFLNATDSMTFKNAYNGQKAVIIKELDYLKRLDMRQQLLDKCQPKQALIEKVEKFQTYLELEKFLEVSLQLTDRDLRKYAMFQHILPSCEQMNCLYLTGLMNLINTSSTATPLVENEGDIRSAHKELFDSVNTVRVNESIVEAHAQFNPPNDMMDTSQQQTTHKKQQSSIFQHEVVQESEKGDESRAYEDEGFEEATEEHMTPQPQKVQQHTKDRSTPLQEVPQENEEDAYGEEDDKSQSIQITEEQMLDIAETVFQVIADRLKIMKLNVKQAFGKRYQIMEEFEGDNNVVIIAAQDFLESLRSLQITQLSELEIACLMRVLSKPEIDHAIVMGELNLVLENFGITYQDEDPEVLKQEVEQKKQKMTKKKQIKQVIAQDEELYQTLAEVLEKFQFNVERLMEIFKAKQYDQMVKSKKKELKVELIKREDFFGLIEQHTGVVVDNQGVVEAMQEVLQIDPKYNDIFQIKSTQQMLSEVVARVQKEEKDRKVLEEFYKPDAAEEEEPNAEENGQSSIKSGKQNVEVMNFEQLMNDDEEDYYTGEAPEPMSHSKKTSTLNEIAEDAANEDQQSPDIYK